MGWSRESGATERDRRLNNAAIPMAFTDLLAAAVQFLPNSAKSRNEATWVHSEQRAALSRAVCAADIAGAADWPEAAAALLSRCRTILREPVPVIPGALVRAATETEWPAAAPARHSWMERVDLR